MNPVLVLILALIAYFGVLIAVSIYWCCCFRRHQAPHRPAVATRDWGVQTDTPAALLDHLSAGPTRPPLRQRMPRAVDDNNSYTETALEILRRRELMNIERMTAALATHDTEFQDSSDSSEFQDASDDDDGHALEEEWRRRARFTVLPPDHEAELQDDDSDDDVLGLQKVLWRRARWPSP